MSTDERLKARDITPTIDAVKAYQLGQADERQRVYRLLDRTARLERAVTEIYLQAGRAMR